MLRSGSFRFACRSPGRLQQSEFHFFLIALPSRNDGLRLAPKCPSVPVTTFPFPVFTSSPPATRHPRGLLVTVNAFRLERDEGLSSLLNSVAMTLG